MLLPSLTGVTNVPTRCCFPNRLSRISGVDPEASDVVLAVSDVPVVMLQVSNDADVVLVVPNDADVVLVVPNDADVVLVVPNDADVVLDRS